MFRAVATLLTLALATPVLAGLALIGAFLAPRSEVPPRCGRIWSRLLLRATGARVRFAGERRLDDVRPAVLVANHSSFVDVYAICAHLPIPFRMVAKEALFRIPIFGPAMRAGGFVPLERARSREDIKRLEQLRWDAERLSIIVFYPEGTRSRDGRLGRFKRGAFMTALRERLPIVPVAIAGTHRVQPAGSLYGRGGEVVITVLAPISTEGLTEADRERVTEEARARIRAALPPDQQGEA